jgi:GNAT superfamily N-acetyltransferase
VALFHDVLPPERAAEAEAMRAPSLAAVRERLAAGDTLAWLAESPGADGVPEAAGSLVMHLVHRLPSPKSPSGREGYIVHVFVHAPWRNAGLGARLLAAAEAEARRRGCSRLRLHSADRALAFYLREGWRPRTNDLERLLG